MPEPASGIKEKLSVEAAQDAVTVNNKETLLLQVDYVSIVQVLVIKYDPASALSSLDHVTVLLLSSSVINAVDKIEGVGVI
jgi:hypothetical protein